MMLNYSYPFSDAKVLLFSELCKVLVSPFAVAICNYAEIVVSLQHFSAQKMRTTDCYPANEVVGYPCSQIINAVARLCIIKRGISTAII